MSLVFQPYKKLSFGTGELLVEMGFESRSPGYYDWGEVPRYQISYSKNGQTEKLSSLFDITALASKHSVNVTSEVSKDPLGWADFISRTNEIEFPLLREGPMYKEYYAKLDLTFEHVKPNVSADFLIWHSIKRDSSGAYLLKIQCDLRTFAVQTTTVKQLKPTA